MARKNVFVSMGFPYTESHRGFLDALIELLRSCDVEPRVMNKTDYPTRNPLTDISQVMRECHGAIVVAFERTYFESGLESRSRLSRCATQRLGTRSKLRWRLLSGFPSLC